MSGDKGFFLTVMLRHFPRYEQWLPKENVDTEPARPLVSKDAVGFISGFLGGVGDTICNFPPYGLHLRLQDNKSINPFKNPQFYRPRELYRGTAAYSVIIPITCIADGFSEYLKRHFTMDAFMATFISGMTAAFFVTAPTSNTIVYQQKNAVSAKVAIRQIMAKYGAYRFTTGMSLYMLREGIYSVSVFSAKPWLQTQNAYFQNDIVASVLVGIVATILSQPCDTIATYMVGADKRMSPLKAIPAMYHGYEHDGTRSEGGLRRFYRGFLLRGYAVVAGIYVMSKVSNATKRAFNVNNE